jgi:glycosyltransferase involved in cell wall biosynthesis
MTRGISVVIITLNEERNISNAILSVKSWADEIIVMDMSSDDQTQEISRSLGALVYEYPRVVAFDAARVAAVGYATHDWLLLLDADELIPQKLSEKLLSLRDTGTADVYSIPRLNYFSGAPLLHTGFGPAEDRQIRFYRKGSVRLNETLHAHLQPEPGSRVEFLDFDPRACLIHFNYKSSSQFVAKLNKYTSLTAMQRKDSQRFRDRSLAVVPLAEFLNRYIRKQGFRDGWRGFYYAFMMAAYRMTQNAKIREMQSGCDEDGSAKEYQKIAEQVLLQYAGQTHDNMQGLEATPKANMRK